MIRESAGAFSQKIETLDKSNLPQNDVLIKVAYAGLNYKDALSTFGHKGITKNYPHTPGVDVSGQVIEDKSGRWKKGQKVICTSYDLGMNTPGGFSEFVSVPNHWVIPLPEGIDLKESMALGTAAYTAGLAIYKMMQSGQKPEMGKIVVTGATGGVGLMALALLKRAGFESIASTGKLDKSDFLISMGATEVIPRSETNEESKRPLLSSRWAGAIDNVGGNTLSTLIKACGRNGNVASIGLVQSHELDLTVFPFILNGVNLLGVDSAETPYELRTQIWNKVAGLWKPQNLEEMFTEITFEELVPTLTKIKDGLAVGRYILKVN